MKVVEITFFLPSHMHASTKGGLISESFSLQLKSPKLAAKSFSFLREDAQGDSAEDRDLASFFGDLSQSEKLSEIRPPLALHFAKIENKGISKTFFIPCFHINIFFPRHTFLQRKEK